MRNLSQVTYIWLDGSIPTQQLRSKTRILQLSDDSVSLDKFPEWGYDGSSTNQAHGDHSDLLLKPVFFIDNPLSSNGTKDYLVLCEVLNPDGTSHSTNTRAALRAAMSNGGAVQDPWIGFEQEYTLFKDGKPLGWPKQGFPLPQGPYYCGVGANKVYGRELVLQHTQACLDAGIMIFGTNAEVMPGQWEFQVGYRGIDEESADPLTVSDHLWIGRWLLHRLAEDQGISVMLDVKPVKGDWNGSGKHTNFSTNKMRDKDSGMDEIKRVISCLERSHKQHILAYGYGLEERLTGLHETASITKFTHGISDRGASVRIPADVANKGYGYIEDRRPGANADPYVVATMLLESTGQ